MKVIIDAQPVLEHHALRVEVHERCTFLHVRQHGGVVEAEPAILSATAPPIGEDVEERNLGGLGVMFDQTFRAVLVVGSKAIVRIAAQSVAVPLHLEQTGSPLVVSFACDTARFGAGP